MNGIARSRIDVGTRTHTSRTDMTMHVRLFAAFVFAAWFAQVIVNDDQSTIETAE